MAITHPVGSLSLGNFPDLLPEEKSKSFWAVNYPEPLTTEDVVNAEISLLDEVVNYCVGLQEKLTLLVPKPPREADHNERESGDTPTPSVEKVQE